jgi:hypothetical protein
MEVYEAQNRGSKYNRILGSHLLTNREFRKIKKEVTVLGMIDLDMYIDEEDFVEDDKLFKNKFVFHSIDEFEGLAKGYVYVSHTEVVAIKSKLWLYLVIYGLYLFDFVIIGIYCYYN